MANDNFLTISKAKCKEAYIEILKNSDKKWNTSKLIAESGDYGSACSIAIISLEELVKALIVFFDGQGFNFRNIKGMKTLFRNHQVRYFLLFFLFVMGLMKDELVSMMLKIRNKPVSVLSRYISSILGKNRFQDKTKEYVIQKSIELNMEIERFSNVDALRQESLYTDFDGNLKSPVTISREDYEILHFRLSKAREAGKGIINSFETNDESTIGHIENFKKDFAKNGYYKNIENAFKYMNDTRLSPFDAFMKSVFDIELKNDSYS